MLDIDDKVRFKALKFFDKVANEWGLSLTEKCAWLGDYGEGCYEHMLTADCPIIMDDEVVRISHALHIYNCLHMILSEYADMWMTMQNSDPVFGGKTPLQYCLSGIQGILNTRKYLEFYAYSGGGS